MNDTFLFLKDTLIVWSEGDNFDLALSFQEKAGCDEIWEKICQVQGKDPSVDITQVSWAVQLYSTHWIAIIVLFYNHSVHNFDLGKL